MPSAGEFHRYYWGRRTSTGVKAALAAGKGGYPLWQSAVIVPSLFGMLGAWLDTWFARLRWHWRLARRLHVMDGERRAVVLRVVEVVEDAVYPLAQQAVRQTAQTLGFNRPEAWKELSREMKGTPGNAENTYRHLHACAIVRRGLTSTRTNPEIHFATELAYLDFTLHPHRRVMERR